MTPTHPLPFPAFPIDGSRSRADYERQLEKFKTLQSELANISSSSTAYPQKVQELDQLIDHLYTYPWNWLPEYGFVRILCRRDNDWAFAYSNVPESYQGKVAVELRYGHLKRYKTIVFPCVQEGVRAAVLALHECGNSKHLIFDQAVAQCANNNSTIDFLTAFDLYWQAS